MCLYVRAYVHIRADVGTSCMIHLLIVESLLSRVFHSCIDFPGRVPNVASIPMLGE